MSLIALDLDGTLIENKWPALGGWLPGAVEAVQALLSAGHDCYIFSSRLYHLWPNGKPRTPEQIATERRRVRDLLDEAGLFNVSIGEGKPPYDVMIDDKTLRFVGWEHAMLPLSIILRDEGMYDQAEAL